MDLSAALLLPLSLDVAGKAQERRGTFTLPPPGDFLRRHRAMLMPNTCRLAQGLAMREETKPCPDKTSGSADTTLLTSFSRSDPPSSCSLPYFLSLF
ncbi:hypothetical protein MRX96_029452 [Rhipicephalus microplus]